MATVKNKRNKITAVIIAAAATVAIVLIIVLIATGSGSHGDFSEGLEYLSSLEARSPSQVREILNDRKRAAILSDVLSDLGLSSLQGEIGDELSDEELENIILEAVDKKRQRMLDGEEDIWSQITDFVLFGDSRTGGFWTNTDLPVERVLAESGATIRDLEDHIDEIVAFAPVNLIISVGMNDISSADVYEGFWETSDEYIAEYEEIIGQIREALPDVNIFICATFTAKDPAFERSTRWYHIPEWNEAVREMCDRLDMFYISEDNIEEEHPEFWGEDGIHFSGGIYRYWGANIACGIYEYNLRQSLADLL